MFYNGSYPRADAASHRRYLARAVHDRLNEHYHPPFLHERDRLGPLSQLVYEIVAEGASRTTADAVFRTLTVRFWDWTALRDLPVWRAETLLRGAPDAARKAAVVAEVLEIVSQWSARRAEPSLACLAPLSDAAALARLESLPGVTPDIAAAALLFSSVRRAVLPVSPQHRRVAERLGLLSPGAPPRAARAALRAQLPAEWGSADLERVTFQMGDLGRLFCKERYPNCPHCPVRDLCPRFCSAASSIPAPTSVPGVHPDVAGEHASDALDGDGLRRRPAASTPPRLGSARRARAWNSDK